MSPDQWPATSESVVARLTALINYIIIIITAIGVRPEETLAVRDGGDQGTGIQVGLQWRWLDLHIGMIVNIHAIMVVVLREEMVAQMVRSLSVLLMSIDLLSLGENGIHELWTFPQ